MSGVQRESLLKSYIANQVSFLKPLYPKKTEEELTQIVRTIAQNNLKKPKAKIIKHPSPGNSELVEVDLLSHIRENSNKIITPCSTIYKPTDEQVAFDKQFIDMLRNNRDVAKKAMLKYKAEGRTQEAKLEDFKQSLSKILVNSIIGSNGNNQNAMYDLESFNGVTSMARHGVIMAYAYVERFLTSNFYFPDLEHAINYIVTVKNLCPSKEVIYGLTEKYKLINPLPCEVADMLLEGLKYYTYNHASNQIKLNQILEAMPHHELTFIYYSRNLYNLFTANSTFWKNWIHKFTNYHSEIYDFDLTINEVKPEDLYKLDGDLLQVIATIYSNELKGMQIKKTPSDNPELARRLALIGHCMQKQLDETSDLLDVFLHNETCVSHIHLQRNIVRKCVAISDTDSVIFTTKHLVSWFLGGELKFSQDAYNINAIVVYLLTKSIASIIRHMSIARGATGDNIEMIEMKNEYLYPVLIKTGIGKHYAGRITVQEGNFLPTPTMDIKGVAFMSSNIPKISHDFVKKFLIRIQDEMIEYGNLYASDFIMMAYEYEQSIIKSLKNGEFTYFPNIAIRNKDEYKKPESSVFVNYEFWQHVFSEKYGDINIPTKVPIIPITPKSITDKSYLNWLEQENNSVYRKMIKFTEKLNGKDITRIPLSISLATVPREIVPIVQIRPIVYKNMAPVQLALKSLGIDLGNPKKMPLLSDYYSADVTK